MRARRVTEVRFRCAPLGVLTRHQMSHDKLGGVVFLPHLACVVAFLSCLLLSSVLAAQRGIPTSDTDKGVRLSTIPRRVFVDNDGIVEPWSTESFVFFVVVEDERNTPVAPVEARVELLSNGEVVQTMELSGQALQALRGVRFRTPRVALPEAFDLRHHLSVPVSLSVDRVRYRLTLTRGGAVSAAHLEIPLERYESKAELLCPIKGRFMIVAGHDANEPHALGWSQQHAYDIMSLGPSSASHGTMASGTRSISVGASPYWRPRMVSSCRRVTT